MIARSLAVPFSAIPARPVTWTWKEWLPSRHVTLIAAPGGTSKGLLTIDLGSRITAGKPMPGEDTSQSPMNIIVIAPEDDANEAVAPRLAAAGADLARVFNLTVLPGGQPFMLPDHIPELNISILQIQESTELPVGMVIIDPLLACIDRPISTDGAARRIIAPLEETAKRYSIPILLTQHTVKSGKIASASGLVNACRMVLRITKDAPDSPWRTLSVEKSNIAVTGRELRYQLVGEDLDAHIEWASDAAETMDDRGYEVIPITRRKYAEILTGLLSVPCPECRAPTMHGCTQAGNITAEAADPQIRSGFRKLTKPASGLTQLSPETSIHTTRADAAVTAEMVTLDDLLSQYPAFAA